MCRRRVDRHSCHGLVDQQNGRRGRLRLRALPLSRLLRYLSSERNAIQYGYICPHTRRHTSGRPPYRFHRLGLFCPVVEAESRGTRNTMAVMGEARLAFVDEQPGVVAVETLAQDGECTRECGRGGHRYAAS